MLGIIIVFPRMEDAVNIKNLLVRNGYDINAVCTTGAQAISVANELDEGIVISGYRMPDMLYFDLNYYLPKGFEMLLIASAGRLSETGVSDIVALKMPMKPGDLLDTLQMMTYNFRRRKKRERERLGPKTRSQKEKEIIEKAKCLLMDRNHMTEEEAHRYIQKTSMDSGTNMSEMAEMILATMS